MFGLLLDYENKANMQNASYSRLYDYLQRKKVLMQQQILWNGRSALDAAGYLLLELIS
jgi:hypothetical protein